MLKSEGYKAYLKFGTVRGSEQWNAFIQWQQQLKNQQQSHFQSLSNQSNMLHGVEEEAMEG